MIKEIRLDYNPSTIRGRMRYNFEYKEKFIGWQKALFLQQVPKGSEVVVVKYVNEVVSIYYKEK